MILFKRARDLAGWLEQERISGKSLGFVPTMGALHAGHISLITISKNSADITVCSIFVNPTQFNDPRDFQKYPVTLEKDIALLEGSGADALFLPAVEELYPAGSGHLETYEIGGLETVLEGKFRPGHFQGVCQVMRRLLDIVRPDDLFMGSKDYQQCMVVQKLMELQRMPGRFHRCPILREPDGLAMSSRNMRLTPEERTKATAIYQALQSVRQGWAASKPIPAILSAAFALLEAADFRVDYVSIANVTTLDPLESRPPAANAAAPPAIALIAAFQGEVRLIDNMVLND